MVCLRHGPQICRRYGPFAETYFPVGGMFSIVVNIGESKQVEAATVGNEGVLGLPALLGLDFSPYAAAIQVPDESPRLSAAALVRAAKPGGELDRLLRRYAVFSIRSAFQTVACNGLHSVEERACRWLLMARDRAGTEAFVLTHQFLAEMLGVRRQTMTQIAGAIQRAGLIGYHRGVVRVLDRDGLEAACCECYATAKRLYESIMQ